MSREPTGTCGQAASLGRVIRLLLLAALAAALAACSLTRIAYGNAAPLVAFSADSWFDLRTRQKDWVRERVSLAMAWHRASELPEYRAFLREALARSEDGVSEEDARWAYAKLRNYYRRAMEKMLPDMAEFLGQLDAGQAAHLEHRFAEENEKLVKESLQGTPSERSERRARRFIGYFEDWTGRLSPEQRELVAARLADIPDLSQERMADRHFRQSETLALLRGSPSHAATIEGLRRILVDTDAWRRPQYREKLEDRDRRMFALVGAIGATLDTGQREYFARELRGYLKDIDRLASQR